MLYEYIEKLNIKAACKRKIFKNGGFFQVECRVQKLKWKI